MAEPCDGPCNLTALGMAIKHFDRRAFEHAVTALLKDVSEAEATECTAFSAIYINRWTYGSKKASISTVLEAAHSRLVNLEKQLACYGDEEERFWQNISLFSGMTSWLDEQLVAPVMLQGKDKDAAELVRLNVRCRFFWLRVLDSRTHAECFAYHGHSSFTVRVEEILGEMRQQLRHLASVERLIDELAAAEGYLKPGSPSDSGPTSISSSRSQGTADSASESTTTLPLPILTSTATLSTAEPEFTSSKVERNGEFNKIHVRFRPEGENMLVLLDTGSFASTVNRGLLQHNLPSVSTRLLSYGPLNVSGIAGSFQVQDYAHFDVFIQGVHNGQDVLIKVSIVALIEDHDDEDGPELLLGIDFLNQQKMVWHAAARHVTIGEADDAVVALHM